MIVTAQDGITIKAVEFEMTNNVIYAVTANKTGKLELGRYADLKRACEVLAEMVCMGRGNRKKYVMPKN